MLYRKNSAELERQNTQCTSDDDQTYTSKQTEVLSQTEEIAPMLGIPPFLPYLCQHYERVVLLLLI